MSYQEIDWDEDEDEDEDGSEEEDYCNPDECEGCDICGGPPLSQEEYLDRLRAEGRDTRPYDPSYIHINGYRPIWVKRSTLRQVRRIERIRWRLLERSTALWDRRLELVKEIHANGGEFFVAPKISDDELAELDDEDRAEALLPSYFSVENRYYGLSTNEDHDYWKYKPTKHGGSEMEVIAAAAELGEWEQVILPGRLVRSQDPVKLEYGRRFAHLEETERGVFNRSGTISMILARAIIELHVLPEGRDYGKDQVFVEINGRNYPFNVAKTYAEPDMERWPHPRSLPNVRIESDEFPFDGALKGFRKDVVRTRYGEPQSIVKSKTGDTWIYPQGAVQFERTSYHDVVVEVNVQPAGVAAR